MDPWDDSDDIYFNEIIDPRILEARKIPRKSKYNDDNPSFDTAMRGPFQAEFWQCPKPSDQPRDAARREECSDLDEKSLTTFCR